MQQPTSLKLQRLLPSFYQELHRKNAFDGVTFRIYLPDLIDHVPEFRQLKWLDFGCGPKGGLAQVPELAGQVVSYDPHVKQYSIDWVQTEFNAFFSADVLEHLTWPEIYSTLASLAAKNLEVIFLVIATRSATTTLPNGINAHLTVQNGNWWLGVTQSILHHNMVCVHCHEDHLKEYVLLVFRKR